MSASVIELTHSNVPNLNYSVLPFAIAENHEALEVPILGKVSIIEIFCFLQNKIKYCKSEF